MKLTNEFEVPVPVEEAWPLLLDVERIIPCMPGAELLERIGDSAYKGRVSVQLGPVLLTFEGVAKFVDIDQAARRARVEAQGTDKKGRGGAHATVVFALMPAGSSSRVVIDTDLQLSGSVAQYGRASGLITSIAKELVGQFAQNLGQQLGASNVATDADALGDSTEVQPKIDVKPISGLQLVLCAVGASLSVFFRRLFTRQ